jgi:hypothetical protein
MMISLDAYYYDDERYGRKQPSYKPRSRRKLAQRKIAFPNLKPMLVSDASGNFARRLEKSLPPTSDKRFAQHFAKLDALSTDESLWVEGTEPPSPAVLAVARLILRQLETEALEPTKVVASVEGGAGLCFVDGDKYADIECLNSGEILGVVSNRRDRPAVWKIKPDAVGYAEAAARIRAFIGYAPRSNDAKW